MGELGDRLRQMSPERRQYALETLPSHLAKASQFDRLHRLLTDFDFIEAKLSALGIQLLIEDYDLATSSDPPNPPDQEWQEDENHPSISSKGQQDKNHPPLNQGGQRGELKDKADTLKLIQGALRLSAHILAKDKTQLAGQLLGRLLSFEVPEIQAMLQQANPKQTPWLRPLLPSLMPPGGALLRTLTGHTDAVQAVVVTPDSRRVISGSNDTTIKVWNWTTGEELFTLTGHTKAVKAVAVTPDGQLLISGSSDKTLKVWNLSTGEALFTLTGHLGKIQAIAVTPDSQRVISAADDTTLKVWNLSTGEELFSLSGHLDSVQAIALTPDSKRVISGSDDTTVKVWHLKAKKKERLTLIAHTESIQAIAVSPNGKLVISGSNDTTLKVWHLKTARELFTLI